MATSVISPLESTQLAQAVTEASVHLEEAKRALAEAELRVAEADAAYITTCQAARAKGVKVEKVEFLATNGIPMTSTFVDGTGKNSALDEAMFAKRIGAKKWNTITTAVLDKAKLKLALDAGVISPADVAMCTKTGDRKSYGRFTTNTADVKAVKRVTTALKRIPRQTGKANN